MPARTPQPPDARFGKFDGIAGGVAQVQRPAPLRPGEGALDGDAGGGEAVVPTVDLRAGGGEAGVTGPGGTVRWDGEGAVRRRLGRGRRPEEEEDRPLQAEEDVPPVDLGEALQAENMFVEVGRFGEVFGVEGGFEDSHGGSFVAGRRRER